MIKSTNAYFDTDKLYLVKPSIVVSNTKKSVVMEQNIDNIDIAFINEKGIFGLVNNKIYNSFNQYDVNNKNAYLGVFDNDTELLVYYLFKNYFGVEPSVDLVKNLINGKKYYEIDELCELYSKIIPMIDDTKKVKKLSKF